jgi:hypothetical protein
MPIRQQPGCSHELPPGWRLSARGNFWRKWGDKTVTIFRRPHGYSWCVADASGPAYSQVSYDHPLAAVYAVLRHLDELETRPLP